MAVALIGIDGLWICNAQRCGETAIEEAATGFAAQNRDVIYPDI